MLKCTIYDLIFSLSLFNRLVDQEAYKLWLLRPITKKWQCWASLWMIMGAGFSWLVEAIYGVHLTIFIPISLSKSDRDIFGFEILLLRCCLAQT